MPAATIPFESESVRRVHSMLHDKVNKTPVLVSKTLSDVASVLLGSQQITQKCGPRIELFFKCENMQKTGSFKYRGAMNSILGLSDDELKRGLITTSSGNHGKALARAASDMSKEKGFAIPVCVVMPNNAMIPKILSTEDCGADVVCSGPSWQERDFALKQLQTKTQATVVSTSLDPSIFLGQGTLGIEFTDQVKQTYGHSLDAIIAPCGSGGMLAGLAVALHGSPTQVFGAEPSEGGADDAGRGREIGSRIETVNSPSIADGLRCPVGKLPWEIVKRADYVEDMFSVTDEQIRETMKLVYDEFHMVIEPSAAVALAVVFFSEEFRDLAAAQTESWRIGVVLSGGNIDLQTVVDIVS